MRAVRYTFGTISVDADSREVSRGTEPLHLTRKAFDLLLLLLAHRPAAVTKDAIYASLWPDTFVAESSLQTLIHEIRQVIDGDRSQPSWIRTVHGIGYSFSGDVIVNAAAPPPAPLKRPAAWLLGQLVRVALYAGENILGRGAEDVVDIDLPPVSRRHARLLIEDNVTIEDLGSKNGTWVDDVRLTGPQVVADGQSVCLGSARFTFRRVRSSQSTESAEMPRPATDPPGD